MNLSNLEKGQCGKVLKIKVNQEVKRRLNELGIIPGSKIYFIRKSPLGDPTSFYVRGNTVSIRQSECENIIIKNIKDFKYE